MLQIKNFRKAYNRHIALQIDSFTINAGVYWVRGTNGSGKSTFLKAIAGLTYFEGDIILNKGINSKKQSVAYRSAVNFAEAEPLFPEFLTGVELIKLFKKAKNAPKEQEDFYVESMGMTSYLHDPVRTYSSGMLKKLSLVLAFMGRPTCILLDEPLTTLDAESLPILYSWITNHTNQREMIFLISSHQIFAEELLPTAQEIIVENKTIRYAS